MNEYFERFMIWIPDHFAAPARITLIVILALIALRAIHRVMLRLPETIAERQMSGIAVGFGAQTLVKDYFTGFFLLLENQVRHGDVIEAGGKAGVVEELTLRHSLWRERGARYRRDARCRQGHASGSTDGADQEGIEIPCPHRKIVQVPG